MHQSLKLLIQIVVMLSQHMTVVKPMSKYVLTGQTVDKPTGHEIDNTKQQNEIQCMWKCGSTTGCFYASFRGEECVTMQNISLYQDVNVTSELQPWKTYKKCVCRCDDSWVLFGDSCYKFNNETTDWNSSSIRCQGIGSELVSIETPEENLFIWSLISSHLIACPTHVWTGGNDVIIEGEWRWSNGNLLSYTRWYGTEPDDGAGSDCLVLRCDRDGYWSNRQCTRYYMYICERQCNEQCNEQ